MPRRSPPSPLRLHTGPLPSRNKPRHTLPSMPRPALSFVSTQTQAQKPTTVMVGPVPRARAGNPELPPLFILADAPGATPSSWSASASASATPEGTWSGPSSPTSAASSVPSATATTKRSREFVRGPWDHSGAIHVPFDVGAVLPPPRPAAVVGGLGEGDWGRKWVGQ